MFTCSGINREIVYLTVSPEESYTCADSEAFSTGFLGDQCRDKKRDREGDFRRDGVNAADDERNRSEDV